MSDTLSPAQRSFNMSRIRGRDTSPELVVRSFLHGLGFRYRLHDRRLPGRPDLVFSSRRVAVFVHGCFWHRHANCRYATTPSSNSAFWAKKFQENVTRDQRARINLEAIGWRVLVIWECEVRKPSKLLALARRLNTSAVKRR